MTERIVQIIVTTYDHESKQFTDVIPRNPAYVYKDPMQGHQKKSGMMKGEKSIALSP